MHDSIQAKDMLAFKRSLDRERRAIFRRKLLANKPLLIGAAVIAIVFLMALFAPLITPYDPLEMNIINKLKAPSAEHVFGTDQFGRDVFSRIVYAAQSSMGIGLSIALFTSLLGTVIGLYASYYKSLDQVLMRLCDGLMAMPVILLAMAIMAALGPSIRNLFIALSIVYTPAVARIVRSAALVVREQNYVEAMQAQGASAMRIIWKHMAPNTLSPLIVQATFIFADAVILEAGLSFLGVGVPAPQPSWGNILYDGKAVIYDAWWMTVFPGLTIVATVLGLNLFGDGLRDLLDPHGKYAKK